MWRSVPLTLFWFVYMGSVGIFFPYFSLYLSENAALSGTELGWVLAILPLVSIFAQPFWGQVADRTGARSQIVALLCLGSLLGYLWLAVAKGFFSILLATALLSLFAVSVLPVTISVSLATLRDAGPHAFGFVRAWGTIGYFVVILMFPWFLDLYQASRGAVAKGGGALESGLGIMFVVAAALVSAAAIIALYMPRTGAVALTAERGDWRLLLYNRVYLRFLLFSFVAHLLSHGPMWLFPIFVRARGGDIETIRWMWVVMLVVEIPLILATGSGLKRLGARGLLGVGVFIGGLRWILCAWIEDLEPLYLVQTLHGVTVVGLLLGSPLYLDLITPEKLRSTAQGVLSMIGVGVAGIVSNLASGWLLDHAGIEALYATTGIGSAVLGALVWWILPAPEKPINDKVANNPQIEPREGMSVADR